MGDHPLFRQENYFTGEEMFNDFDPEIQKIVLKNYKRGQTPVTGRAADYLEPELEEARQKIGPLARDDFDLLIYALYPTTGEQFLKTKYGLEDKAQ